MHDSSSVNVHRACSLTPQRSRSLILSPKADVADSAVRSYVEAGHSCSQNVFNNGEGPGAWPDNGEYCHLHLKMASSFKVWLNTKYEIVPGSVAAKQCAPGPRSISMRLMSTRSFSIEFWRAR